MVRKYASLLSMNFPQRRDGKGATENKSNRPWKVDQLLKVSTLWLIAVTRISGYPINISIGAIHPAGGLHPGPGASQGTT